MAPSKKPRVYNSNNDVVKALENGQVDALVTDLPTAFFMAAAQLDKGQIVGQLPAVQRHSRSSSGWCWTRAAR